MSGRVPSWLAEWVGISTASTSDDATWRLESAWHWPPWATVLLMVAAVAWTVMLYTRESSADRRFRSLLTVLRLFSIALVLIMIAQWALALHLTGPPTIALVVDRSGSMGTIDQYSQAKLESQIKKGLAASGLNEATRLNLAKSLLIREEDGFVDELSARYRLETYLVDGAVERLPASREAMQLEQSLRELSATGINREATRLGDAVRQVLHDFRGAPPAAIIILSDGISTAGLPLAAAADEAARAGVPLVTVGLGHDEPPQDIELADVLVDDVVFVDDVLSFQIQVKASGLEGQPAKISLRRLGAAESANDSSSVAEETFQLPPTGQTLTTRLMDRPSEPGEITYEVGIQPHDDEYNRDNNRERRIVTVRKEKIRVLLVQAYPSYEFRYLKSLMERDDTIELSTYLQDADLDYAEQDKTALKLFPSGRDELFDYDVLLIGDVDPRRLPRSAWQHVRSFVVEKGGGAAFLAGPRFLPELFADNTDAAALLPIEVIPALGRAKDELPSKLDGGFSILPTLIGLQSPSMQLGDTRSGTEQIWQQLAPLYWLYEVEKLKPAAQVLAVANSARAGSSTRLNSPHAPNPDPYPVIVFQYVGPGRVLFHAIDSTWRWRLGTSEQYFSRYWVQAVRFLARGKLVSGRGAQLTTDRREYRRGDAVQLRARFLDPRLAPSTDTVAVVVDSPGRVRRRVELHRNPAGAGVFEGALADLAEGQYSAIMARPQLPGNPPAARFEVIAPPGELAQLEMDAAALAAAAKTTGGKFYEFEAAGRLIADLPPGRRVDVKNLPPVTLWNRWWLLALFLACLTSEWILRKRNGML